VDLVNIRTALEEDRTYLLDKIEEFWIDGTAFQTGQFLIAEREGIRVGIGRIREHGNCSELCTLGVEEGARRKGVATLLIKALTQKATLPDSLYLVCIIPSLFEPLGYKIVSEYPDAIAEKLKRCETEMSVPEKYVVMKYIGKKTSA
jgi:N-acetylglutamate synthase-like GNAT family acetyltransferase